MEQNMVTFAFQSKVLWTEGYLKGLDSLCNCRLNGTLHRRIFIRQQSNGNVVQVRKQF